MYTSQTETITRICINWLRLLIFLAKTGGGTAKTTVRLAVAKNKHDEERSSRIGPTGNPIRGRLFESTESTECLLQLIEPKRASFVVSKVVLAVLLLDIILRL